MVRRQVVVWMGAVIVGALAAISGLRVGHAEIRGTAQAARSVDGPLVVLDAHGGFGPGPTGAEILAARPGAPARVLARGLPFPFSGGLAPSPDGRYVTFGEDSDEHYANTPGYVTKTEGLWIVGSNGAGLHRLLVPPPSVYATRQDPGNVLAIGPVAWSPDRHTLAYAVNAGGGSFITAGRPERGLGLWLTRYDRASPRYLTTSAQLGHLTARAAGPHDGPPLFVTSLSWSPNGKTLAVGVDRRIVLVDALTGRPRRLVGQGRDAAFSPAASALAYVTGTGTKAVVSSLWVADAQGRHARKLLSTRGPMISPAWAPDGQSIAYVGGASFAGGGTAIQVVDVATGSSHVALTVKGPGIPVGGRFVRLAWMHTRQ